MPPEAILRTIVRFSTDHEVNYALGNKLAKILKLSGFSYSGKTATYEGPIQAAALSVCLNSFWDEVATHGGPGRLDHFWMYSDKGPTRVVTAKKAGKKK
jgi:hypothetical protein